MEPVKQKRKRLTHGQFVVQVVDAGHENERKQKYER